MTSTYYSRLNTGIQRTVKKIIENKKLFSHIYFNETIEGVQFQKAYYKLDNDKFFIFFTKLLHATGKNLRNFLDKVFYLFTEQSKLNYNSKKNEISNNKTLHMTIVLFFRFILKKLFILTKTIDSMLIKNKKIIFKESDILFLPDSFWDHSFSINLVKQAKMNGAKIILFIHDIFPITHENLVDTANVANFKNQFTKIIDLTDGIVCNSKFTKKELISYLVKNKKSYTINQAKIKSVYLGANINQKLNNNIKQTINIKNFYLMVGTIEPRKNHKYVIDAFEKLWNDGLNSKLVIIGRIGWKCNDIIERIKQSTYFQKKLFILNNIDDQTLSTYYTRSKAVIISSLIEGYGLPLVEAIQFKKVVFASDIPIFREIGKNYPIFFSLESPNSLASKIKQFEQNPSSFFNRKIPKIQTWEGCVKDLNQIFIEFVEMWENDKKEH